MPTVEVAVADMVVAPDTVAPSAGPVIEVVTCKMAGFCTLTVVEAVEVLFSVSVASAQSVVDPFAATVVFQGKEYRVPLAVEVDPMRVLEANDVPKRP